MEVDEADAIQLDLMLHALLLAQSGIPVLYSGDEIGQCNDETYHDDPVKAADSRYLHRGAMDWKAAKKRKDPATPQGKIYGGLQNLLALRTANRSFSAEADVWGIEPHNDHVLAFGCYHEGQVVVAMFNFSAEDQKVNLADGGLFRDMQNGQTCHLNNLRLPAHGFCWLEEIR